MGRRVYQEAKTELMATQAARETLQGEVSRAETHIGQLKVQLQDKKEEVQALRAQIGETVPRKEFSEVKGELRSVQLLAAGTLKDLEAAKEEASKQQQTVQALRDTIDGMRASMAEMVPRSKQLASQAEAKTAAEELQISQREVAALQESLRKVRQDNSGLHGKVDELCASMAESVPRLELSKAKAEVKSWRDSSESSEAEATAMRKQVAEYRDKIDSLHREVDDLNAQLAITAPKAQLLAAQEGERTVKGVVEEQTKEIQRLQNLVSRLRSELEHNQRAFDDYKLKNDDKVPRVDHLTVQGELRDRNEAVTALEEQVATLQGNKGELLKIQAGLQDEVEAWKEKAGEMVDRAEMMAVKSEAHAQSLRMSEVRTQLDDALAAATKFKEQLYGTKLELSASKEAMSEMVSRREHMAVVSESNMTADELRHVRDDLSHSQLALDKAKGEISLLKGKLQELSGRVYGLVSARSCVDVERPCVVNSIWD